MVVDYISCMSTTWEGQPYSIACKDDSVFEQKQSLMSAGEEPGNEASDLFWMTFSVSVELVG